MLFYKTGLNLALMIVGSIGGYQLIQNARIPACVKLITKVRKNISGKKTISDSRVTLSRNDEIVEQFADVWKLLDLDLKSILGLEEGIGSDAGYLASDEEAAGGF